MGERVIPCQDHLVQFLEVLMSNNLSDWNRYPSGVSEEGSEGQEHEESPNLFHQL